MLQAAKGHSTPAQGQQAQGVHIGDKEITQRIRAQRRTLEPWREIRQTMPLQYVYTFLLVAERPGLPVLEYAKIAGVAHTVMSRHILDLGPRNRKMEPGFGLLETRQDQQDLRVHTVHLTREGERLKRRLAELHTWGD
jgi:DNA-binding MarR family transcriptional regulator